MRELKYLVACTVDGFIARADGSFDFFPSDGEHFADLIAQFPEMLPTHMRAQFDLAGAPNREFDTVLMGRRTYQVGLDAGIASPYSHLKQYVFTRSMKQSPSADVTLVATEKPAELVARLKREDGQPIWLCGGSQLAAALFSEIDELILKVSPIVIGSGLPLFAAPVPVTTLRLVSTTPYSNGFVLSRYRKAGH